MLDSLEIKNYRNLEDLQIKSLGTVNLLTGKNNTGKSTLLEAVAIYASKGDISVILELLVERGEYPKEPKFQFSINKSDIRTISSIFTNRVTKFEKENSIRIGEIIENKKNKNETNGNSLIIHFIKYNYESLLNSKVGLSKELKIFSENDTNLNNSEYKVGLEIKFGSENGIYTFEEEGFYNYGYNDEYIRDNYQFIRTRNIDKEINGKLWDNIILTDKENNVIEALKIIEPTTEKVAFIEGNSKDRSAVIKLSGSQAVLPLLSMGDGINRILTIILALVNAENGYLLIDEFENGLHHSVQEKLWKIIFTLAEKLNVQVFATTHSEDCISGFEQVLNKEGNADKGKLIRLENIKGHIKQVEFDANELKIANENDIEIR